MDKDLAQKPRHLIQVVNRRTGINSDVIRAWERRYKAIVSQRTSTNRRLYSDSDIEKLSSGTHLFLNLEFNISFKISCSFLLLPVAK